MLLFCRSFIFIKYNVLEQTQIQIKACSYLLRGSTFSVASFDGSILERPLLRLAEKLNARIKENFSTYIILESTRMIDDKILYAQI